MGCKKCRDNQRLITELGEAYDKVKAAEVEALDWIHENKETPQDEDLFHAYEEKAEAIYQAERIVLQLVAKLLEI